MTFPIEFRWREDPPEDFGIPYRPNVRSEGENFGYFDLKRDLGRIDDIPELRDWPPLRKMVQTVNEPTSFFRTVACDTGILDTSGDPPLKRVGCYFRIAFEILKWNLDKENYHYLFDAIYQRCSSTRLTNKVVVAGGIKPTHFNDHGVFGWTLMIDVSGYAPTEQEARESWTQAMELLENIFIEISADKADQLTSGEATIS